MVLAVDTAEPPAAADAVIAAFARIKRETVGAPFQHLFGMLASGGITAATPFAVSLRAGEQVYFCPGADRVTIGYGLVFADKTDAALMRVFCAQFVEVQRKIGAAPVVAVHEVGGAGGVPAAIAKSGLPLLTEGAAGEDGFVGYVTLTYFPSHVDSPAKMENTVTLASSFRTYLNYHLKAAKSYIHSRMRTRVDGLLQVLSRAHASDPTTKKVKKTFQGKTLKVRS